MVGETSLHHDLADFFVFEVLLDLDFVEEQVKVESYQYVESLVGVPRMENTNLIQRCHVMGRRRHILHELVAYSLDICAGYLQEAAHVQRNENHMHNVRCWCPLQRCVK